MKRKTWLTKGLSIFFTVTFMISPFSMSVNAEENVDFSKKIDSFLSEKISNDSSNATYPVNIWLSDIDHDEVGKQATAVKKQLNSLTKSKGLISNETLSSVISSGDNIQRLDEYQVDVELKRKVYSRSYSQHNQSIGEQLLSNAAFDTSAYGANVSSSSPTLQWYSEYAPVIKMILTKDQILEVAKSDSVSYIYDGNISIGCKVDDVINTEMITQTDEVLPAMSSASVWQRATNADINRDTYGYDGTGVKVGILDAGILKWSELSTSEQSVFSSIYNAGRLIVDPNVTDGSDNDHTAYCASIIVSGLSSNKGLAPNVTLYSSCGNRTGQAEGAFEWLIAQGVNVISCSVSWEGNASGTYSYMARYIDHIYVHHDTTIVLSAGNTTSATSQPPGSSMSYNAIVVGSTNDNGTTTRSDDTYATHSCYSTNSALAVKPDVVAPGYEITTALGAGTGTSYSAPQVAAIVAQLFTQRPSLKTGQTLSKAIIMASIGSYGVRGTDQIISTAGTNSPALHQKLGAGEVDAAGVRYIVKNYRYVNTTFTSSTSVYTKTFNVSSSDTLMNVALVWQKNNRMTGSHTSYNDPANPACPCLTMEITAPNGTKFTSARTTGNVQMLSFVPVGTGTYTIKVTKVSAPTSEPTVTFALAWR